ncbi:hypothetical protein RRG08_063227 [Elysia crispata]|uniref:Transglutaminase C-terminal domain-containing protein n=1 Tax=Elysia crispata TaxID=231223 RepID=A0AAE1CVH4_9GAST|nr:hypothetical protein RRG08_063227 [Elysia crispata]
MQSWQVYQHETAQLLDETGSDKHLQTRRRLCRGERAAVLKANQLGSSRAGLYELAKNKDVTFILKQDSENTWVGGDFDAFLTIRNDSKQARTVSGRIAVSAMYYTGVVASKLKSEPFASITLKPGQEHEQKVKVCAESMTGS